MKRYLILALLGVLVVFAALAAPGVTSADPGGGNGGGTPPSCSTHPQVRNCTSP